MIIIMSKKETGMREFMKIRKLNEKRLTISVDK